MTQEEKCEENVIPSLKDIITKNIIHKDDNFNPEYNRNDSALKCLH